MDGACLFVYNCGLFITTPIVSLADVTDFKEIGVISSFVVAAIK